MSRNKCLLSALTLCHIGCGIVVITLDCSIHMTFVLTSVMVRHSKTNVSALYLAWLYKTRSGLEVSQDHRVYGPRVCLSGRQATYMWWSSWMSLLQDNPLNLKKNATFGWAQGLTGFNELTGTLGCTQTKPFACLQTFKHESCLFYFDRMDVYWPSVWA